MKRNQAVDYLRIASIVGVVVIHVFNRSFGLGYYRLSQMPLLFAFERLARFAVPFFFIITGYTLTKNYRPGIRAFYKKRAAKLLVPYVVWSMAYMALSEGFALSKLASAGSLTKLSDGTAAIHLYFIPSLLLIYAFFPFLYSVKKYISVRSFTAITIAECALLSYDYFVGPIVGYDPLRVSLLTLYLVLVGMMTADRELAVTAFVRRHARPVIVIAVLFYFLYAVVSAALFTPTQSYAYLFSQWQPFLYAYSVCLWTLSFTLLSGRNLPPWTTPVAKHVFFIFFIHVLYLSLFWKLAGSYLYSVTQGQIVYALWFNPVVSAIILGASFATAAFMNRVAFVRPFVGLE